MEEKNYYFYEYYVWKIYLIEFKNDIQLSVNYEIFNTCLTVYMYLFENYFQPRDRDKPPITAVVEIQKQPEMGKIEETNETVQESKEVDVINEADKETPRIEEISDTKESLKVRTRHCLCVVVCMFVSYSELDFRH
jgi:hypothetical protein